MALRSLTLLNPSGSTAPTPVLIPEDCEFLGFTGFSIQMVSTDQSITLTDLAAGQGNFDPEVLINYGLIGLAGAPSYPLRKGSVIYVTFTGQGWGQLLFKQLTAEDQVLDFA